MFKIKSETGTRASVEAIVKGQVIILTVYGDETGKAIALEPSEALELAKAIIKAAKE